MTAYDDIMREFREFKRYTGDGLPGAPVNAPLPVGDPQSGPWNPKKSGLRLALGNLALELMSGIVIVNGAIPAINAARDAAIQEIHDQIDPIVDLVAGYASDAVSQGNVPIYATAVGIAALNIPAGINAFRSNGYYAAGDGGSALYKKVGVEPAHGGKLHSADGAWWEYAEKTINPRALGVVGDYVTNDTAAWDRVLAMFSVTKLPVVAGPMNIGYVGSFDWPAGIRFHGAGPADLNVWYADDGDSPNCRPGYKHLIGGTNIWFKQAGNKTYNTNRSDAYASFTYGCSYISQIKPHIEGLGMIADFNIYDVAGVKTGASNDNRATYGCVYLHRGPHGRLNNCLIRGFVGLQGAVLHSQNNLSVIDTDYFFAHQTHFQGLALLGKDSGVDAGLTGFEGTQCGFYSVADHHTPADGDYTRRAIFIDGDNGIGGIRGHKFRGNLRTKANIAVEFGHCNNVLMDLTYELPALAGVPNADLAGGFLGHSYTGSLIFLGVPRDNGGPNGLYNLGGQLISGSIHAVTGQDTNIGGLGSDTFICSKGKWARMGINGIGDSYIQFAKGPTITGTSGWLIRRDDDNNDTLQFLYDGAEKGSMSTDGTLQLDVGVRFRTSTGPRIMYGTAIPTTGDYIRGDTIFNTAPSAGGKVGWSCITAGAPGAWKPFGAIDA